MDNFVRTGFMEAVSYIFSHFLEYFKLFLMTILNIFIIYLLSKIPYLGFIIAFILNIITIAFIPYGVTLIVCDIKIDFSIYQKFFNFLRIASMKEVMMTTLQLKLISTIYEDDDLEFYHNEAGKYNCIFLWKFVPIINLISSYVICTVFARDIKRYFDL